jgi:hypothetical protein
MQKQFEMLSNFIHCGVGLFNKRIRFFILFQMFDSLEDNDNIVNKEYKDD